MATPKASAVKSKSKLTKKELKQDRLMEYTVKVVTSQPITTDEIVQALHNELPDETMVCATVTNFRVLPKAKEKKEKVIA